MYKRIKLQIPQYILLYCFVKYVLGILSFEIFHFYISFNVGRTGTNETR